MVEGSTFLWFPWTVALCAQVTHNAPEEEMQRIAERACPRLVGRINDMIKFARDDPFAYVMAESLFAMREHIAHVKRPSQ